MDGGVRAGLYFNNAEEIMSGFHGHVFSVVRSIIATATNHGGRGDES
jgi:hypothetical protein